MYKWYMWPFVSDFFELLYFQDLVMLLAFNNIAFFFVTELILMNIQHFIPLSADVADLGCFLYC